MRYLYGDGTSYPLDENFIQTLVHVTDLCVKLFQAEIQLAGRNAQAERVRQLAAKELLRLEDLAHKINGQLGRPKSLGVLGRAGVGRASRDIESDSKKAIDAAQKRVVKARDAAIHKILGGMPCAGLADLVAPMLCHRLLPGSVWGVHWTAAPKKAARSEVVATYPHEFRTSFSCDHGSGIWSAPLPLDSLVPRLSLPVPARRGQLKEIDLSRHVIVEIECSKDRELFRVQKRGRRLLPGLVIEVRRGDRATPLLWAVTAEGERMGDEVVLAGNSVSDIALVWAHVRRLFPALVLSRNTLREATIAGQALDSLAHPAILAQTLLDLCSPLIAEMKKRSPRPGEIILQREDERGVKPFALPSEVLAKKLARLPEEHRQMFVRAGLDDSVPRRFAELSRAVTHKLPLRRQTERMPTEPMNGNDFVITDTEDSGTHAA